MKAFILILTGVLFPMALTLSAAPQSYTFSGAITERFSGSAEIVFPPELAHQLPLSGEFTIDVSRLNPQNTSALSWLGRYTLLAEAVVFAMAAEGGPRWKVTADPDDTLGSGAEQRNDVRVQHGHSSQPDEIQFRVWDRAPAQETFSFLEAGRSGRVILNLKDQEGATDKINAITPPAAVPAGWEWNGDLTYLSNEGGLLFGFHFNMEVVVVNTGFALGIQRLPEGGFAITWDAQDGYTYELQTTTNFETWDNVENLTGALGPRTTVLPPLATPGTRFVKIRRTELPAQ